MCKYNREENKLLQLPLNEPCSLENLGIKCSPATQEACKIAEEALKPFQSED